MGPRGRVLHGGTARLLQLGALPLPDAGSESPMFRKSVTTFLAGLALASGGLGQGVPGRSWGVALEEIRVTARLGEGLARTEVEQVFRNRGPTLAEEDYLFPLPDDAVQNGRAHVRTPVT